MTTQRDDTKVIIEKWRLDSLVEQAREVLESVGRVVGSTVVVADNPDLAVVRDFALKDAARSYNEVGELIEQMKVDFADVTEVKL